MALNVMIGTPEDRVEIPVEEDVSRIGGLPHWLCGEPTNFLPNKCQSCGHNLELIFSAVCPVGSQYDRVLFLYLCPKCGSSARCFRQKRKITTPAADNDVLAPPVAPEPKEEKPEKVLEEIKPTTQDDLFAALAAFDASAPKKQENQKGKGKKQKPRKQYEKGYYPAYYLDIFDEPEEELDPDVKYVMASSAESNSEFGGDEEEKPEVDPILVEYNTRISREPSQVLRYCRGGEPLLQDKMRINVPKCPKCGGDRCFELEVIPTIISKLDPENFDIDFGPILVYTCAKDCGSDGTSEEHVIVCPP